MRRWLTAVALGGAAMLALAGCGNPGGVDGELTDDWKMVSEPKIFEPELGTCHPRQTDVAYLSGYQPVECTASHQVETLHIGTFTGETASRTAVPPAGSAGMREAYAECTSKVNAELGADWRGARLAVTVAMPSRYAWDGGARWFRCDVAEMESLDDDAAVDRTGSLKGVLGKPSDLAHTCFRPKIVNDDIEEMTPVSCTSKHRAEFVGVWNGPDVPFDSMKKDSGRIHKACVGLVASFAKVPNNSDMRYRTGSIYYYPNEEEWANGNRGVQCFLWISGRDLTRSMKGAGSQGLPVR